MRAKAKAKSPKKPTSEIYQKITHFIAKSAIVGSRPMINIRSTVLLTQLYFYNFKVLLY